MEPRRKEAIMRDDAMLPVSEAAAAFDIPRIKLYRWIKTGRLAAYRSGRDERVKLVRRADVAALLEPEPVEVEVGLDLKSAA